jgi:uncharacterized cupredoxin-like copper-binding protein
LFSPLLVGAVSLTCGISLAQQPEKGAPGVTPEKNKAPSAPKPRKIKIRMAEGLRFDPVRFSAKPGEWLSLEIHNEDSSHQPHNLLVVRPGTSQEVVRQALEMGDQGPTKGFIPEHPAVVAATRTVVEPEKSANLDFTVPKEPGVYGYVCSVPGHGVIMYGALYVGVEMPPLAKDTQIPQLTVEKGLAGGGRRPFVQRMFVPEAGPAAIAVALPGAQNFCFDAGECRVRYAWRGPFLDASDHWKGNGSALAVLGNEPWWVSEAFPLQISGRRPPAVRKFLGYKLINGIPEFHYRWGEEEIFESIHPLAEGLELRYRIPNLKHPVLFTTGGVACDWSTPHGKSLPGRLEIQPVKNGEFSVVVVPREPAVPVVPAPKIDPVLKPVKSKQAGNSGNSQ